MMFTKDVQYLPRVGDLRIVPISHFNACVLSALAFE